MMKIRITVENAETMRIAKEREDCKSILLCGHAIEAKQQKNDAERNAMHTARTPMNLKEFVVG